MANPVTTQGVGYDFNNPANWVGGAVPTGNATIALSSAASGPVGFSQTATTLAAINFRNGQLLLTGGQSLTLTGQQGLVVTSSSQLRNLVLLASGSFVNGNVFLNGDIQDAPLSARTPITMAGPGDINGNLSVNAGVLALDNPRSGNSLTVAGSYTQGAQGATTLAGLVTYVAPHFRDPNVLRASAPLVVYNTATLGSNARLFVNVQRALPTSFRFMSFPVITTSGGVTGTFSTVSTGLPLVYAFADYSTFNVHVMLKRDFGSDAVPGHFQAFGDALNQVADVATGDFALALGSVATVSFEQLEYVFNQLSGRGYSAFGTLGVQTAQSFMNTIAQQMGSFRSYGGNRVSLAQACDAAMDADCEGAKRWGAWPSGVGSVLGTATAGTVTYNLGGVSAGLDYQIDPRFLVGLSVGYGSGNVWTNGFDGRGWSNSYNVSLYGSFTTDRLYVDAIAGYANNQNQMKRTIAIPNLASFVAQGQSYANQFLGQVETGYRVGIWQPAEAAITPFARLQGSTNTQAAFSETGASVLNLNVAQHTTNSLRSTLGADLSGAVDLGWREKLAMRLRLGWQHEYAEVSRPVTATFAGAPTVGFTVYGAEAARDSAVLGLAVDTAVAEGFRAYLRYDGDAGATANNHVLSAGLRMTW